MNYTTQVIDTSLSIIILVTSAASVAIIIVIVRRAETASDEFLKKYGTLFEGVNMKNPFNKYWNIFIIVRWAATSTIIVVLRDHYEFQIGTLLLISYFFQVLILVLQPIEGGPLENRLALFNELMVSSYLYVLILLSEYNYENAFREEAGWGLLGVIFLSCFVNLGKFLFKIIVEAKRACRRRLAQRKRRLAEEFEK